MAGGQPVSKKLLQSKLGMNYTIATAEQVKSASLAGMQLYLPSMFAGLSDFIALCICIQFVPETNILYTPMLANVMPRGNPSQSSMTIPSNTPIAFLVFGVKPKPKSYFQIQSQNFDIYPFYASVPGEAPSRTNVWSQFDSFAMCNIKSPNCMYPLQVVFDGITQYVNAVYDSNGTPSLFISQTPETSWIFLPNNLVVILSNNVLFVIVSPKITDKTQYVSFIAYNESASQLNSDTLFKLNVDGSVTSISYPNMGLSCNVLGQITFGSNANAWLKFTQPSWSDMSTSL